MKTIAHFIGSTRITVTMAAVAVGLLIGLAPRTARATCDVACSDVDAVSTADLVTLTAIALGEELATACPELAADGPVTVDDITVAIGELDGCEAPPEPVCGNGVPEAGEECDNGGRCFGTSKAGQYCESDTECIGQAADETRGMCNYGDKAYAACSTNADCPNGQCVKCLPVGGDDCAVNCTYETSYPYSFQPQSGTPPAGSGSVVYSQFPLGNIPVPFQAGSGQTLVGGKARADGLIPFVIRADTVHIPKISIFGGQSCQCIRAAVLKTCGGTWNDKTGQPSPICTEGFANTPATCPADSPCAPVWGEGNSGVGVVGCKGYSPVNITATQRRNPDGTLAPLEVVLGGEGAPGSALILSTTAIGQPVPANSATCADPNFCTDHDKKEWMGVPITVPQVTGTATATFKNADPNHQDIPGPGKPAITVAGERFVCLDGTIDPVQIGSVVNAFPLPKTTAFTYDAVVTSEFRAQ